MGLYGAWALCGALCAFYIILRIVLAPWRQLMVLQRWEDFLELHEEPFAWGVAVGIHVEGGAETVGQVAEQVLVGFGEECG